jgi:hypothetical protein
MAEDPVTRLLKFANFATGQIRDIIKLGKRPVRRKRVKKGSTANHIYSYCIKQERNTRYQDNSEVNCGNVDSKSVSQEGVVYTSSQQEGNNVKHTKNHFFERNTQENSLEYCLHNQDPVHLAVEEEWPSYTDRFLWHMDTVDDNVNHHNYTLTLTEIPDTAGDRICFQHNSDADGYYELCT